MPRLAVSRDDSNVNFHPLAYDGLFRELHLMKRANATPTPVAEAFIDELLKRIDEDA